MGKCKSTSDHIVVAGIIALDLVSFGLAIAAEQRNKQAKVLTDWENYRTYCSYGSDAAMWFGVCAILSLVAGHALATATSWCLCCAGKQLMPRSRVCMVALFICSWLSFFVAEACLIAGTAYYTNFKSTSFHFDTISCDTVRKGFFFAGAAFSVCTGLLGVAYYLSYSKCRVDNYYERDLPIVGRDDGEA